MSHANKKFIQKESGDSAQRAKVKHFDRLHDIPATTTTNTEIPNISLNPFSSGLNIF